MKWNSEELAAHLNAAAQQEDNDEVLQIDRPTGTPIPKTVLFDGKRFSEQQRKAGLWETRKRAGYTETLRELHDTLLHIAFEKMNHQEETALL